MRSILTCQLLLVLLAGCSKSGREPAAEDRILRLERQVEPQRKASAQAVAGYAPKLAGRLDDLAVPAADLLRQLPGVADVEVLVRVAKPTHRIIHLRDWHYVPADLLRQDAGKPLSNEEADALHRAHVLEVELVQLEQEGVLRCLVKHHGLKRVLVEGLTAKGVPAYREVIAALREAHKELADLHGQRARVKKPVLAIDRQVDELIRGHSRQLVEYGAATRLALVDEVEVLPLDDEELLEQAKPMKGMLDPTKNEARHDAQVKAALDSSPCALLILGGGHDLSASVRRLGKGKVEYVRLTTARYKEFAGSD
jgi:hypothetical protein